MSTFVEGLVRRGLLSLLAVGVHACGPDAAPPAEQPGDAWRASPFLPVPPPPEPTAVSQPPENPPDSEDQAAQPNAEPDPEIVAGIRIENFTGLGGVQRYIYDNAAAELRELLLEGQYAVFVYATQFNPVDETGRNYCFAVAGVTRSEPQDRNPRRPGRLFFGFTRSPKIGPLSEEDGVDCKAGATRTALTAFLGQGVEKIVEQARGTERTGPRKPQQRDKTLVTYNASTSSGFDAVDYLAKPVPQSFRAAFDYRYMEVVGISTHTYLDETLVCFGLVGLSAVPPNGLSPRWPGSPVMFAREVDRSEASAPGDVDRCEGSVLQGALSGLLGRTWDSEGLLRNFAATREDDIPLVRGPNP